MKTFGFNFSGHWHTGSGVVMADDKEEALRIINASEEMKWFPAIDESDLQELEEPYKVLLLDDGEE